MSMILPCAEYIHRRNKKKYNQNFVLRQPFQEHESKTLVIVIGETKKRGGFCFKNVS